MIEPNTLKGIVYYMFVILLKEVITKKTKYPSKFNTKL